MIQEDRILLAVLGETVDGSIEIAIEILQLGLTSKKMAMHARLGGPQGLKLNRAAFACIIKFSCQINTFLQFAEGIKAVQGATP